MNKYPLKVVVVGNENEENTSLIRQFVNIRRNGYDGPLQHKHIPGIFSKYLTSVSLDDEEIP